MLRRKTKKLDNGEIIIKGDIKYKKKITPLFILYPNGMPERVKRSIILDRKKNSIEELLKCIKLKEHNLEPEKAVVHPDLLGFRSNIKVLRYERIYINLEKIKKEVKASKISLSHKKEYLEKKYLEITSTEYGEMLYPHILYELENIYEELYKKLENSFKDYGKEQKEIIEKAKKIMEATKLDPDYYLLPIKIEEGRYVNKDGRKKIRI